jgi:hypothetical protein
MKDNQVLINSESDIYIFLEINNIIKEKYVFKNLIKYVGAEK